MKTYAHALGATLLASCFCSEPQACRAQDILVYGGGNARIADGASADGIAGTEFGEVQVASPPVEHQLQIANIDLDTYLVISGPVTVAGSSDFTISTQPNIVSIGSFFPSFFRIAFVPSSPGVKTATITIPNNDPDGTEGTFNFTVHGTGIDTLVLAPPDLSISTLSSGRSRISGGVTKASAKVLITNPGPGATSGGTLQVWSSGDFYLDAQDPLVFEGPIKALPAYVSGQPMKRLNVRVNVEPQRAHGVLFIRALPLPENPPDEDLTNNQTAVSF